MAWQFILNSTWKHTKPIDEKEQRDYLKLIKEELDPDGEYWLENIWYKIDEYTHGSISFYASEEAYTKMIDRINAQRNVSDDLRGCTMIHEFKGSAFAVLSKVGS